jgi:hypothetical protein
VLDALEKTLDGQSNLDWQLLQARWALLRDFKDRPLIVLPEEFDWNELAARYCTAIQTKALSDQELRQVLQALASLRTANAIEGVASDLKRLAGPAKRLK